MKVNFLQTFIIQFIVFVIYASAIDVDGAEGKRQQQAPQAAQTRLQLMLWIPMMPRVQGSSRLLRQLMQRLFCWRCVACLTRRSEYIKIMDKSENPCSLTIWLAGAHAGFALFVLRVLDTSLCPLRTAHA